MVWDPLSAVNLNHPLVQISALALAGRVSFQSCTRFLTVVLRCDSCGAGSSLLAMLAVAPPVPLLVVPPTLFPTAPLVLLPAAPPALWPAVLLEKPCLPHHQYRCLRYETLESVPPLMKVPVGYSKTANSGLSLEQSERPISSSLGHSDDQTLKSSKIVLGTTTLRVCNGNQIST